MKLTRNNIISICMFIAMILMIPGMIWADLSAIEIVIEESYITFTNIDCAATARAIIAFTAFPATIIFFAAFYIYCLLFPIEKTDRRAKV